MTAAELADTIRRYRYNYATEDELQRGLEAALRSEGLHVTREVQLGCGRIDLMVDRVGVEVKIDGTAASALHQLGRYAKDPAVDELVLVTSRTRHAGLRVVDLAVPFEVVVLTGVGL